MNPLVSRCGLHQSLADSIWESSSCYPEKDVNSLFRTKMQSVEVPLMANDLPMRRSVSD